MCNLLAENLIELADAAKLPAMLRGGKPTPRTTIYRYVKNGFRGVHLEAVRTPAGTKTSIEAVERFVERLTNPDAPRAARSGSQRSKAIARAMAELADV